MPPNLLRRLHFWIGALLAANFALVAVTGLLIQHREYFGLDRKTVNRRWLPEGYRPNDPECEIRADIVVTDLHSGHLFGRWGPVAADASAAGVLFMIASGFWMRLICKESRKHRPS